MPTVLECLDKHVLTCISVFVLLLSSIPEAAGHHPIDIDNGYRMFCHKEEQDESFDKHNYVNFDNLALVAAES